MRVLVLSALLLTGCVPWNQIDGPAVGAGVVWEPGRGATPQVTAGYAYERYRSWAGYGAEVQVAAEPWRRRVVVRPIVRGSVVFFVGGVGPTLIWTPEGAELGFTVETAFRLALGAGSNCQQNGGGGCLDEDDTVYPPYLAHLHYRGLFLGRRRALLEFGGSVIGSSYWLAHGERRPNHDD